ncbi:MAG: DinB family protein [Vicinamibacterales bacterium]
MAQPEMWLRGQVPGVVWMLQPAVHAFMQVAEDVGLLVTDLTDAEIWTPPLGAASIGFHCRHLVGATDRLLTYARGQALSAEQMQFLKTEAQSTEGARTAEELTAHVREAMSRAIEAVRAVPDVELSTPREVGRARLPTTVWGLIFHAAEHATRHAGQLATTVKMVRGMRA